MQFPLQLGNIRSIAHITHRDCSQDRGRLLISHGIFSLLGLRTGSAVLCPILPQVGTRSKLPILAALAA